MTDLPPPPAHVAPYVDVLGIDQAIAVFLELGGSEVYFAADPKGRGKLAQLVGIEQARALADVVPGQTCRVPIPRRWIARVLYAKGLPVAAIARRLHVTDRAVRSYTAQDRADARQLPLF